jgi:hypothetical protein
VPKGLLPLVVGAEDGGDSEDELLGSIGAFIAERFERNHNNYRINLQFQVTS